MRNGEMRVKEKMRIRLTLVRSRRDFGRAWLDSHPCRQAVMLYQYPHAVLVYILLRVPSRRGSYNCNTLPGQGRRWRTLLLTVLVTNARVVLLLLPLFMNSLRMTSGRAFESCFSTRIPIIQIPTEFSNSALMMVAYADVSAFMAFYPKYLGST
jgi:hypothetical protein